MRKSIPTVLLLLAARRSNYPHYYYALAVAPLGDGTYERVGFSEHGIGMSDKDLWLMRELQEKGPFQDYILV
jgi:hypothetical protein